MPQENKNKALAYAKQKLDQWTGYDDGVAFRDQLGWEKWKMIGDTIASMFDGVDYSDSIEDVNCVELIAEWLWEDKIENISDPNDFLKSDILEPSYMTTIE